MHCVCIQCLVHQFFVSPGVFFILPCIDKYITVDLRTKSFDVPPQNVRKKNIFCWYLGNYGYLENYVYIWNQFASSCELQGLQYFVPSFLSMFC